MSDYSTKDIGQLQGQDAVRERGPAIVGEEGYTNARHWCDSGEFDLHHQLSVERVIASHWSISSASNDSF
jgi:hypothetical protein